MMVERPDYWVVRLTMVGMDSQLREHVADLLESCDAPSISQTGRYSARRWREKAKCEGIGEEKMYVNIAGGARAGVEVASALQWLSEVGLKKFSDVVDGPLLRATDGKSITHMPLQPGSTYGHLSKAVEKAYFHERAVGTRDQELDLGNHDPENPKIGNHWARRKSDQVARDSMEVTKTTEGLIDEYFGWDQKQARKRQQLHYRGSTDLLKLARVTMML